MSRPAEKDFEDLRVHFSDKKWNKLKEVEKIIYLNQKSNHLFKLSVGLNSKVPEFMRTSDDDEPVAPKPKKGPRPKKRRRDGEECITSDKDSVFIPADRSLRLRTNVVDYKEPPNLDAEWGPLKKPKEKKAVTKKKKKKKEKCFKVHRRELRGLADIVLDRPLRNRTNAVKYTEVPEDDRGTDQPSEEEEEWEESGDEESISSDEESDEETSAPRPRKKKKKKKKKKRGEETEDEQSSDEESDDATETVKVVSPRVSLLRSSVDCMKAKMHQETSTPQPSKEEENEDEQSIPSDEESGDATETVNVVSPRVSLFRSSVDCMKAKMHQETSGSAPQESEDEQSIPSDAQSGVASPRVNLSRLSVDSIKAKMQQCN